jgi:hypothetical protein
MIVKVIKLKSGRFKPATSADECAMASFGVFDSYLPHHLFTRDELKAVESWSGLRFVRPV